jgi:hypothetical protein
MVVPLEQHGMVWRHYYLDDDCLKCLREVEVELAAAGGVVTICQPVGISVAPRAGGTERWEVGHRPALRGKYQSCARQHTMYGCPRPHHATVGPGANISELPNHWF